ncbi:MAG: hypothetical protein L6R30_23580 [Thermoanaerobaculia bacterium]|nr:hypothetical protein [Thermoanaerobaculia bacterium]
MPQRIRLLQSSDWFCGAPSGARGLGLSPELAAVRRSEIDGVAQRIVSLARQEKVDALLLPGNLWQAAAATPDLLLNLMGCLESLAPTPVLIAPGDAEGRGQGNYYNPRVLDVLGLPDWPPNVTVFRERAWTARTFEALPGVQFFGRALWPGDEGLAELDVKDGQNGVRVALACQPSGGSTALTSLARGVSWLALGGNPQPALIVDGERQAGAVSGSASGRSFAETGPRSVWLVTLEGARVSEVRRVASENRVLHDLVIRLVPGDPDLTGTILTSLESAGVKPLDIVRVTVEVPPTSPLLPSVTFSRLADKASSLVVIPRLEPGPWPEPDPRNVEGRFTADLLVRLRQANEPAARDLLQATLFLGRSALAGRSLSPSFGALE